MSNKKQLSVCLRTVDKNLNPFEDFMGFYWLKNIKSDTIELFIKYILIRINLSFDNGSPANMFIWALCWPHPIVVCGRHMGHIGLDYEIKMDHPIICITNKICYLLGYELTKELVRGKQGILC